jgi:curved DNA-binding protein CbpA
MDVTPIGTPDPYAVLGVTAEASRAEIVHAFRQRVRELHPDAGAADTDGGIRAVIAAYGVLSDPAQRAAVDRAGPRRTVRPAGTTRPMSTRRPAADPLGSSRHPSGPPLRVGPVRVEPAPYPSHEPLIDVTTLAQLLARWLRSGEWRW